MGWTAARLGSVRRSWVGTGLGLRERKWGQPEDVSGCFRASRCDKQLTSTGCFERKPRDFQCGASTPARCAGPCGGRGNRLREGDSSEATSVSLNLSLPQPKCMLSSQHCLDYTHQGGIPPGTFLVTGRLVPMRHAGHRWSASADCSSRWGQI